MFWLTKFFTKGKTVKDAIKYFHTLNGRMPNNLETIKIKNAFMEQNRPSNVIDITSRIKDDWWKARGFIRQHPEAAKKIKKADEDPTSAMYDRHTKEIESLDTTKGGMGFYSELGDMMKRHRREELEFKYDEMFNKILEKAKRIERDPKVLLEAELGTKLTGEETTTQLLDLFSKRPKKASGGIAGQLHLNRPGYSGGALVRLLKFLKGGGKKKTNAEIMAEILKNVRKDTSPYKHIDMKKLMEGKDPIKLYSGSTIRQTNTPEYFAELAKEMGVSPHRIKKEMLKDQWFTPFESYAKSFTDPKDITSKMRTVDLTPQEIGMAKRYVEKLNKLEKSSMAKKLGLKDPPKFNIDVEDKTVIIPRYKLKELEESGRMKKDYMILEKLKKKLGLAKGGIAGQLHLNQGGRARFQTGGPLSEQDFYSKFWQYPGDPNYYKQGGWDIYSGPTDYKEYMKDFDIDAMRDPFQAASTNVPGTPIVPTGGVDVQGGRIVPSIQDPGSGKYDFIDASGVPTAISDQQVEMMLGAPKTSTNVPGTPIVPTGLTNADLLNSSITLPDGTTVSRGEPGYPGTTASTPVASTPDDLLTGDVDIGMTPKTSELGVMETFQKELQQHVENNQKLKNALARGEITPEEYNILGGWDVKQTMGTDPLMGGVAALAYQGAQSAIGGTGQKFQENISPETDLMQGDIDIGAPVTDATTQGPGKLIMDTARNIQGLTGLTPDQQEQYNRIVGGVISPHDLSPAKPAPTLDDWGSGPTTIMTPGMEAARAKGYDARMGRTYAENIQAMADPRMRGPMGAAKGGLAKILGV